MQVRSITLPRTASGAPTASGGPCRMPVVSTPTLDGAVVRPRLEVGRPLETRRPLIANMLLLVVAVAAVTAEFVASDPSERAALSSRPGSAGSAGFRISVRDSVGRRCDATHVTAPELHVPHVQHGNHARPKWLAVVAAPHRFIYRSPGTVVAPAGGFYTLVLTA
jgi:hypothetical protein